MPRLLRNNTRVLERLRRGCQPEELGPLGNPELWKRSATAGHGHRARGCTFKVQKHPNIWSVLAMSQSSTQKQTSLAQQGHRVFDLVRKFAKGAQEIEATLTSTTGEFLRFGNNELGQSQFTKSRTLSVRLASGKKQARTTTGRLDESFIQKAVENFSLTVAADNQNQTAFDMSTFADISELDPKQVSETALERARLNKAQSEVAPGKFDVVIDPNAWSEMLFFFIVSASTGFSPDFGVRQYREGRSYLSGRMGEKIIGDNMRLVDDVYHPLQTGPAFDGEGYPKSKLSLVENGLLKGLASSRISAHRYDGVDPTGHELPLPNPLGEAPTNLVVEGKGGTKTTDELVGELDKGLLLTRLWYIREVEPRTKTLTGMTRDGTFLVENGEIKRPVKNLRFNQSLLDLFKNIDGFTEPIRNTSFTGTAMLQPGILARDFNFTSVSPF